MKINKYVAKYSDKFSKIFVFPFQLLHVVILSLTLTNRKFNEYISCQNGVSTEMFLST